MYFFENLRKFAQTDHIAAVLHDEELSYRQLNTESDALALWLDRYYQPRQAPVAIYGDKENSALCAIFGANKGGHAYIFLPFYYPQQRLSRMLHDSGAKLIIVCSDAPCPFGEQDGVRLLYANHAHPLAESVAEFMGQTPPEELCAGDDELWGIFYTSGSTGEPKSVGISGRNIKTKVEMALAANQNAYFDEPMRLLDPVNYAFAMSLQPVYLDRATWGNTAYAVDIATLRNFPALMQIIFDKQINQLGGTSTLLSYMLQHPLFNEQHLPGLKAFALGGEPVPVSLVQEFRRHFPRVPLLVCFGATETCSAPLCGFITDQMLGSERVSDIMPVGRVDDFAGMVRLVNEQGEPVADGEIGEFLFEGDYVVSGYLNDEKLTAEKFYTAANGKRGFRSGDLGLSSSGYYYFIGRANNMYKIGGYRVEMEDVENALRQLDIVQNAIAVPVLQGGNAVMLAAYVVLNARGSELKKLEATLEIKKRLAELRPDYMIPQRIIFVDALPVNSNGKLDRQKLIEAERLG